MRAPLIAVLLAPLGWGALGGAGSQSCASAGDAIPEEERQSVDEAIQQEDRQLGAESLKLLQLRAAAATLEQGEGGPAAPRQRRAGGEAGAAAALRSAANATWTSYHGDPCRHMMGVAMGFGYACVPEKNGHSHSFVLCNSYRRVFGGSCEQSMGQGSRCDLREVSHTANPCDNPVCRNRGAHAGDGTYCSSEAAGGQVVFCKGGDRPWVKDDCLNRHYYSPGRGWLTKHYKCRGVHNRARCEYSHTTAGTTTRPPN